MVLARELRKHAVGLAQRRIGPLDDRLQVLAACGEARSQVVQDQAEPVGERLAHDVVDEVDVDLLAVVLERQEALAGARLRVRDHLERRRRLRLRGVRLRRLAVDVLLAEERGRPDDAGGILAEVLEAGVRDVHHDDRLAGIRAFVAIRPLAWHRHVDGGDTSHLRSRDPHVLAGDQERPVVEDPADLVAATGAARPLGDEDQRDRGQQRGCCDNPSHQPGGTSLGSHLPSRLPPSRNGFDPAMGCVAPPGQRVKVPN